MEKYRIKHNDNIIDLQLENKVNKINKDFAKDRLKSFKNSVKNITNNIAEFLLNMGEPSFSNRQADKILDSEEYNENVEEIYTDITNAYSQLNSLQQISKDNYNYSEIYSDFLRPIANKIESKANDIPVYIDDPANINLNIREDFNDLNEIDEDSNANIDTQEGIATLGIKENENIIPPETEITIEDDSNGFPGSKREVVIESSDIEVGEKYQEYIEEEEDRQVRFKNEENPHIHTSNMIDGDPDTMFQYELCNIPEDIKDKHLKDFELEYEDGETWAKDPDRGYLKLTIKVKLPEPKVTNSLRIEPYQPSAEDAGEVKITKLGLSPHEDSEAEYVYDDEDPSIRQNEKIRREGNLFKFEERNIQIVYVTLEQHSPYETYIGNVFCEHRAVVEETDSYLWGAVETSETEERVERVECGQISLENLKSASETNMLEVAATGAGAAAGASIGSQYGAAIGSIGGPAGSVLGGIAGGIIGGLMASGLASTETEVIDEETKVGMEAFPGRRWALGIKNLALERANYSKESKIITQNYMTPNEIRKIKIESTESIPEIFYSGKSDQTSYDSKDEWLKYYFSVDDGGSWHRIDANDNLEDTPSIYVFNSEEIEELKKEDYGYLETEGEPDQIKYKIELRRPDDIDNAERYTPEIISFNSDLVVLPYSREEEDNEY